MRVWTGKIPRWAGDFEIAGVEFIRHASPLKKALSLFLVLLGLAVLVGLGRPVSHLFLTWWNDPVALPESSGINDASRLAASTPAEVVKIVAEPAAAEKQLAELVQRAAAEGKRISISGARHTMGGHALYPDGIVLDMLPFNQISLDESQRLLRVGSGARWRDIIPYLDQRGYAVAVMQSNNDFTVGGSISVNCHGWQNDSPPIASTVESFRILTSDGSIRSCSRGENPELFSLALGGYGLFGVILDVKLRVVPNEFYRAEAHRVKPADYARVYRELTRGQSDLGMAYGRINVAPTGFLEDAIITLMRREKTDQSPMNTLSEKKPDLLKRLVFRGSVGSEYGKNLRWKLETTLGGETGKKPLSRNQIMNSSADWFANRDPGRTEILHEYFLPAARLGEFFEKARAIFLKHRPDLMNITVRNVETDGDTFLNYAREDVFGLVMLFNQGLDEASERAMKEFARELIDAALDCGGTYYLPYRPHATLDQFERAYPQAREFFKRKKTYDPAGVFENTFYLNYGKPLLEPFPVTSPR